MRRYWLVGAILVAVGLLAARLPATQAGPDAMSERLFLPLVMAPAH